MSKEISLERYKNAYRELMLKKAAREFKVHAIVYGCVNAVYLQ